VGVTPPSTIPAIANGLGNQEEEDQRKREVDNGKEFGKRKRLVVLPRCRVSTVGPHCLCYHLLNAGDQLRARSHSVAGCSILSTGVCNAKF